MSGTDRDLVAAIRAELAAIDAGPAVRPARRDRGLGPGSTREPALAASSSGSAGARRRVDARAARPTPTGGHVGGLAGFVLPAEPFDWAGPAEHCRIGVAAGPLPRPRLAEPRRRPGAPRVRRRPSTRRRARATGWRASGCPASWRVRRGHGVVTWKSARVDRARSSRRIGASAALLELEARQVARSPPRRPQPGPQRRVGEPAAVGRRRGPPARGDRRRSRPTAGSASSRRTVRARGRGAGARRPRRRCREIADSPRPPPLGGAARARPARAAGPPRRRGGRAAPDAVGRGGGRPAGDGDRSLTATRPAAARPSPLA